MREDVCLDQVGRKDKGEEKCPHLGRSSQPDLLMDWTQGVRERVELKMVPTVLASTTEPHETLSCFCLKESIFTISFLGFFVIFFSHFPFPASASASLS